MLQRELEQNAPAIAAVIDEAISPAPILTSAQRDENRLTGADKIRIYDHVAHALALHKASATRRDWVPWWSDVDAYKRIAHHAIGCSERDLRQSELDEIERIVTDTLELTARTRDSAAWRVTTAGPHGCDPCDKCGNRPPAGARVWVNSHRDLVCDPCLQARRDI
jgi:hypothetical protein